MAVSLPFSNLGLNQGWVPVSENRVLVVWWRILQQQSEILEMEGVCSPMIMSTCSLSFYLISSMCPYIIVH